MKTLFAIVGGVCSGLIVFFAGSETYKTNKAYRKWYDGVDKHNETFVKETIKK